MKGGNMLTMLIEVGWFFQGAWRGEEILVGPFETLDARSDWVNDFLAELHKLNEKLGLQVRERISCEVGAASEREDLKALTDAGYYFMSAKPSVITARIEKLYSAAKTC